MLKRIKIGELIRAKKAHSQTGPFGTQLKASEYVEYGIPLINVRNIGMGNIRSENLEYLNDSKALELKSHRLKKDDIVFGRKGAVERHSYITEKEEGWIQGSDCIRLRILTDEFNPKFISYFFRTQAHQQWMINLGSFGATMGSLNQEIISKIEIPDIPRSKQDEITSILSTYDDLIENNNQRIKLLEEMAEEIYKEWFVRMRFPGYQDCKFFDNEENEVPHGTPGALPEGWAEVKANKICKFPYGKMPDEKEDSQTDEFPFEIQSGHGRKGYSSKHNISSPSIVITVRGSVGRVEVLYDKCWITNLAVIVKYSSSIKSLHFLFHQFKTQKLEWLNTGSAIPQITSGDLGFVKIFIPKENIQKVFEETVSPFYSEARTLKKKNQILQETRDLLLPRLISGKLDVSKLEINESEILSVAAEPEVNYQS